MRKLLSCVLLAAAFFVELGLARHAKADPQGGQHEGGPPPGIAWYAGDVSGAFDAAKQQHKPLFVYFGAVWCPPCLELKATLFRRKDFLERLQLFVPVYVDGDSPDAQRWMQTLHVIAYPTVLILKSDRSEIDRVTGGMNLDRYASVLDTSSRAVRPLNEIMASLDRGVPALGIDDCRVLAYNGWDSDESWLAGKTGSTRLIQIADDLRKAAERCPQSAHLERARLQVLTAYAVATADADNIESGGALDPHLATDLERARAVVENRGIAREMAEVLAFIPDEFLLAMRKVDPAHTAELTQGLIEDLSQLETDTRYSPSVRLFATYEKISLSKGSDPHAVLPPALVQEAKQKVDAALRSTSNSNERAPVVDAAFFVFQALGDDERANTLLHDEIKTSATPYYYMIGLAELAERQGRKDEALGWFARAYDESQGPATRLQWGCEYIQSLLRLKPQDDAAVRAAVVKVFTEARDSDVLYGRSRHKLDAVAEKLRAWNSEGKHRETLAQIHGALDSGCGSRVRSASAQQACKQVLAEI